MKPWAKDDRLVKSYWKVPGRDVYCDTLFMWARETLYCHIWLRFFAPNMNKE